MSENDTGGSLSFLASRAKKEIALITEEEAIAILRSAESKVRAKRKEKP